MFLQESMIIPSLYTVEDQAVIGRWMRTAPVYPERDDLGDANSIAEIVLSSIQESLPQGFSTDENGGTAVESKNWECPASMRHKLIFPIRLIDIERNDSLLGTACHETYYATLLPGYRIYVITVSQDSPSHGYFDVAIDFFQDDNDAAETAANAGSSLKAWWRFQHKVLQKPRWEKIVSSGIIDADSALLLRDAAWNNLEKTDKIFS